MKRATLLLLAFLLPSALAAATKSWTGSINGNWSNGANWADGTPPVAGDDLVFGNSPATRSLVNDFPAGMVFHSLSFAEHYDISGNGFGVSRGMSASGVGDVTVRVPVSLAATQTWFGSIAFTSSAAIDLGPYTLTFSQYRGPIDAVISGSGGIVVESELTFTAANTFTGTTTVRTRQGLMHCNCTLPGIVIASESGTFSFEPGAQVGSTTTAVGTIALGDSAASTGNLVLDSASIFSVHGVTTMHAPLLVAGPVSLEDAMLDFSASSALPLGTVITLIDKAGDPVEGTFANLPEGARFKWSSTSPTEAQISYRGGDGNDVTLTIVPQLVATTTTLTVTPNPTPAGQTTTLTALVVGADVPPAGFVVFYDNTAVIAQQFLRPGTGVATVTVGPLSRGVHPITAMFVPNDPTFTGSSSPVVQLNVEVPTAATTTTLAVTPNPSRRGDPVTLTATVTSDSGAPAGSVIFTDGDAIVAAQPLVAGSASFTTSDLTAGTHTLRATFVPTSSDVAPSTSNVVAQVVVEVGKHRAARH